MGALQRIAQQDVRLRSAHAPVAVTRFPSTELAEVALEGYALEVALETVFRLLDTVELLLIIAKLAVKASLANAPIFGPRISNIIIIIGCNFPTQ